MFEIAQGVRTIAYVVFALVGLAIGAVSGTLFSIALKLPVRHIVLNAILGAAGFLITWFFVTLSRCAYPISAAVIAAAACPAVHEVIRFKRMRSAVG